MIDFAALKEAVKPKLDEDRSIQTVDAEGADLDAAVHEAATLLDIPIYNLEYEVLALKTGFLGIGENICKIRAFERLKAKKRRLTQELEMEVEDDFGDLELIEDSDGDVFVQRRSAGIYMKVSPPTGAGVPAVFADALDVLKQHGIVGWSEAEVKKTVKAATGMYGWIGEYESNPLNDAVAHIEIAESDMRAYITVDPPRLGGCDISNEDYLALLKSHGVVYGINKDFLVDFADKPIYRQRICVATGKKPVDGMDSYMEFFFELGQSKARFVADNSGQVNFRELNIIQNVTKGERLAVKNDPERGVEGCTVKGIVIPASDGKDIAIQLGSNVRFAPDKHTVVSDISGQVVFAGGKIHVEEVFVVDGSVGLKTGNISFLGNVIISGNVEEGFSVRAAGNIEIHGVVSKASLEAGGDIIIERGISGKEDAKICAAGDIWSKFMENAKVNAGGSVYVTDGIVNSQVSASKRIICQGKRASILGGRLCAGEEIDAKQIGSASGGTQTVCEVGYDPKRKLQLEVLEKDQAQWQFELDNIMLDITTLDKTKEQQGELPEGKEDYYSSLIEEADKLKKTLADLNGEMKRLNEELNAMRTNGKISASVKLMPGVVICICDQRETIRAEFKGATFRLENAIIQAAPYMSALAPPRNRTQKNG